MTTTTWTFLNGFNAWTFENSTDPADDFGKTFCSTCLASRTHVTGASRNTLFLPDEADVIAVGNHRSPVLNATIENGDTIALDFGASSEPMDIFIEAIYTDNTTEDTTVVASGSGTLTLTLTQSKTLDHIRIRAANSTGVSAEGFTNVKDFTEVRLVTATAFIFSYDMILSAGEAGTAMGVSQDGANLFFAMENDVTGFPIIIKTARPVSTTPSHTAVYIPTAGTTANIAPTGDPDRMIFHGNFGTDVGVIDHAIAAGTNTDITMPTIGAELIQPLKVDPSDVAHIVAINRNDQDALETEDGGSSWATLNAALGQAVDAMDLIFFGAYFPFGGFIGGNDGVDENLSYAPSEFANLRDDASAALKAVGSIVSIDIAPDV